MRRFRLANRLAEIRHISDEELLSHLDGELSSRRAAEVRWHLQSCWNCRSRAEKMERAISELVDARNAFHSAAPPPGEWHEFDARLSAAAREEAAKKRAWRSFSIPEVPVGIVAAAAAVLCLAVWLIESPSVSAQEVLHRAESAECSEIRGTSEPVIYQKIQARRKVRGRIRTANIESWTDWSRQRVVRRGDAELWRDLDEMLRNNRMASRPLLSPAAYMSWRDGLKARKEQIVRGRLQNGSEVLEITTSVDGTPTPGSIREARLVVRTADWHSVKQSVRVGPQDDDREFELSELAFDVRPLAAVDKSLFDVPPRVVPVPVIAPRAIPLALPPEPAPLDPDEVMARSLLALHEVGACLREQIEVLRDSDGVLTARGVAETADRKSKLAGVLREAGVSRVEIETTEDALRRLAVQRQPETALEPTAPAEKFKSGKPPIADRWKDVLDPNEMTRLSNAAVTLSEEWLAHAAALGRIDRHFPIDRTVKLSAHSAFLLGEAVKDHTAAMRRAVERFQEALASLRVPETAPATGEEQTADRADLGHLESEATEARRLTLQLFAGSGAAQEGVDEILGRLLDALGSLHARSRRLEISAAKIFRSDNESVEADLRRIP